MSHSKRRLPWVVAAFIAVLLCGYSTARADDSIEVHLPGGAYARPGRPIVVRVAGGALRVRSSRGPWALPQGERGDEFVLQVDVAQDGRIELEVDIGTGVARADLRVARLDGPGPFRATFGEPRPGCVVVPRDALPTVREAWLPFDAVDDAPVGAARSAQQAIASFRSLGPDGSGRPPWFEPLTFAPGVEAFRAMAEVEREAPSVPGSAALAAALSGVASLLLLAVSRGRATRVRLAWAGAPVVAFLVFVAAAAPLPGAARATAATFVHDGVALVLVRVSAVRAADIRLPLPPGATSAAQLRFGPDDPTSASVETGRSVRLRLGAGEHRIFAYAVPVADPPGDVDPRADARSPGPALVRFLESRRLEIIDRQGVVPAGVLPSGSRPPCLQGATLRVAPGK